MADPRHPTAVLVVRSVEDVEEYRQLILRQAIAEDYEAAACTRARLVAGVFHAIVAGRVDPKRAAKLMLRVYDITTPGWP